MNPKDKLMTEFLPNLQHKHTIFQDHNVQSQSHELQQGDFKKFTFWTIFPYIKAIQKFTYIQKNCFLAVYKKKMFYKGRAHPLDAKAESTLYKGSLAL